MAESCTHQKCHYEDNSEYHLFTWSIPRIFTIDNLDVAQSFKIRDGTVCCALLRASEDRIIFSIESRNRVLKCSVSLCLGFDILFSNTLNVPTRKNSLLNIYDLVSLSCKEECFQQLKDHPNDTLVLICRIKDPGFSFRTSGSATMSSLYNFKTLAAALKDSSESLSKQKVIFRVAEESVTASKAILCARSKVFAKMFKNDTTELEKSLVTITDIKMNVLKSFVSFLYTGKVLNRDFDFLCDLYYSAAKYDVVDLRLLCVDELLPQISMKNIFRVLKLGFSHNDELLKSTAMTKIVVNIDDWLLTGEWEKLVNEEPDIANGILKFIDF